MKNTRMLTEGAIMIAVFVVLLLITLYVPIVSIILQYFLVIPFLLYSAKYPIKNSLLFLLATVLVSFIIGSFGGIAFAIIFGTLGLMMGYGIRKKYSKEIIYVSSSFVFLASIIVLFIVSASFFELNFITELGAILRESVDQSLNTFTALGQSPPAIVEEQLDKMIEMIGLMTPFLFTAFAFITVIIIILITFPIIKRLGIDVPKFKPFRLLQFPKSILWYYLLILITTLFIKTEQGSYLNMVLLNGDLILQILLVLQGLAVIFYYAHYKKWNIAIPIVAVVLTVFIPLFLPFVSLLGIIDIGFDLRRRLKQ
ncbi:YybS family protein [Lederbergia graminis]|uniref:YybS family protein n=1 Tax=Lederbergia graminis TaxID=735518 RepID=A0ABW0LJE4_9BACI